MTALAAEMPRLFGRISVAELAAATGKCRRSAINWIEGRTQPSAADLVAVMAEFPELISEVAEVAGHKVITQAQYDAAKKALQILEGQ